MSKRVAKDSLHGFLSNSNVSALVETTTTTAAAAAAAAAAAQFPLLAVIAATETPLTWLDILSQL